MSLYFSNHYPDTIYVALVYGWGTPPSFSWYKTGWWALASGQTSLIVDGPIHEEASQYYYFYAQTADGGTYWAGPLAVQVTDNVFNQSFWDDTRMDREVGFRELDTNGYETFTLTFVGNTPWAGPWPVFHHDVRHTGLSEFDTSTNGGTLKWKFAMSAGGLEISWPPAIGSDGTVHMGTDGTLYAINPNGSLNWTSSAGGWTSPAIGTDGTIYIGAERLCALSPDGNIMWSFYLYDGATSNPTTGADGTIYIGSDKLYALDRDGALIWSFTAEGSIAASVAIGADGTIYFGSGGMTLYALTSDGSLKWSFDTPGQGPASSPAVGADGTIYVASNDNFLYALNPDGTTKWSFNFSDDTGSDPAIGADGTIYIAGGLKNLYAFNPDGTLKWTFLTGSAALSNPSIGSDGTVYVGSFDNSIYAFNSDGTLKWRFDTGGAVSAPPAIGADGTIYFGCSDNYLYALH
jgi:outer membrane protein assembly factor BamB